MCARGSQGGKFDLLSPGIPRGNGVRGIRPSRSILEDINGDCGSAGGLPTPVHWTGCSIQSMAPRRSASLILWQATGSNLVFSKSLNRLVHTMLLNVVLGTWLPRGRLELLIGWRGSGHASSGSLGPAWEARMESLCATLTQRSESRSQSTAGFQ